MGNSEITGDPAGKIKKPRSIRIKVPAFLAGRKREKSQIQETKRKNKILPELLPLTTKKVQKNKQEKEGITRDKKKKPET